MPQTVFVVLEPGLSGREGATTEAALAPRAPFGQLLLHVHSITGGTGPGIVETRVEIADDFFAGHLGRWVFHFDFGLFFLAAILRCLVVRINGFKHSIDMDVAYRGQGQGVMVRRDVRHDLSKSNEN